MNSQYVFHCGEAYTRINTELPDRARIMVPTARSIWALFVGMSCIWPVAAEFYTRQLKEWGAQSVLG
jgi:hypothetical protein